MGLTVLFYKLFQFKDDLAAMLKRCCCHGNVSHKLILYFIPQFIPQLDSLKGATLNQIVKRPLEDVTFLIKFLQTFRNFVTFPMLFHQLGFLTTTLFYSRHLTIVRTHVLSVL